MLVDAQWERGDESVLIRRDGRVVEGDDFVFQLDAAGRVFDEDNEAIALLNPDGSVSGPDDTYLGRVGVHNASPPWTSVAWLRVRRDGKVALYDSDGEAHHAGTWRGCVGPVMRTCTLVTHLLALEAARRYRDSVQVGVGLGMWY